MCSSGPSSSSLAGTGPNGITADVIVVHSFEELDARSAEVPGTYTPQCPNTPTLQCVAPKRLASARRPANALL